MTAFVRGFNALQQELEKTKESLKDVDENIKKLTGRDPTDVGRSTQQRRILLGFNERGPNAGGEPLVSRGNRKRVPMVGKWSTNDTEQGLPHKKRGNIASRLGPRPSRSSQDSGDGDDMTRKPSVPSSVVATTRDSLTRKDMLDAQGKDERGMARNKRMFGLLLGTLQKFKDEAKHKKDKHDQRKQVELKLEEKAQQERDEIRKERELLFENRREKQARIRLLEQKMELVATHEKCETEIQKLANFICTKTKPSIFYLPKVHTPATESRLAETGKVVEEMIGERRRRLAAEIDELMGPSSLASSLEAGHHQEEDIEDEDDDGENIPTSRREREEAQSTSNNKRFHRSNIGAKDWSSKSNKDNRKPSKRSSSTGGSGSAGGADPYHPASKHGRSWDERPSDAHHRSGKPSSKDPFASSGASSAISSKALSNKWQLLMEMDSGLEEDEEKVAASAAVPLKPAAPLSTHDAASLTLLPSPRDRADHEAEEEEEEAMETDKREVRLEESSMNGTEDKRLVETTTTSSGGGGSGGGGVASGGGRRVVLAVKDDDDDDDNDHHHDNNDDDDDDDDDVTMKTETEN